MPAPAHAKITCADLPQVVRADFYMPVAVRVRPGCLSCRHERPAADRSSFKRAEYQRGVWRRACVGCAATAVTLATG